MDFLIWGNNLAAYSDAFLRFVLVIAILKLGQVVLLSRLKKMAERTATHFDNVLLEVFEQIRPPFYLLLALYIGLKRLTFSPLAATVIDMVFLIVVVYEIVRAVERMLDFFLKRFLFRGSARQEDDRVSQSVIQNIKILVRFSLWITAIIVVLSNLGFNVTSLIASLGIGGVAIALASQSILADMFSSFTLHLDKPFRVGDFIAFADSSGTVERIGLKTTRIKTLQGEQLIVSNTELSKARVQNFKKLKRRRVAFMISIAYDTPSHLLEKIPGMVEKIVESVESATFDRCHFFEYADSSLKFEIVFHVESADFAVYMDVRQKINLAIHRTFQQEQIEFAFPNKKTAIQPPGKNGAV